MYLKSFLYSLVEKRQEIQRVLISRAVSLVNVPCKDFNLYEKAVFLGLMCRRLLQAQQGMIKADDRDYYGNKRIQLAGDLISLLFEEHFKNFNDELKRTIGKKLEKKTAQVFNKNAVSKCEPFIDRSLT